MDQTNAEIAHAKCLHFATMFQREGIVFLKRSGKTLSTLGIDKPTCLWVRWPLCRKQIQRAAKIMAEKGGIVSEATNYGHTWANGASSQSSYWSYFAPMYSCPAIHHAGNLGDGASCTMNETSKHNQMSIVYLNLKTIILVSKNELLLGWPCWYIGWIIFTGPASCLILHNSGKKTCCGMLLTQHVHVVNWCKLVVGGVS